MDYITNLKRQSAEVKSLLKAKKAISETHSAPPKSTRSDTEWEELLMEKRDLAKELKFAKPNTIDVPCPKLMRTPSNDSDSTTGILE